MSIEPIESYATGPAQTIDEKAKVLLETINFYVLRTDPSYCNKVIYDVEGFYSKNKKEMPYEIKSKIEEIKEMLKG
ncbi:MAG: hypothetical protein QXK80_02030 [Candidatus Pacearchaeota archaeon]